MAKAKISIDVVGLREEVKSLRNLLTECLPALCGYMGRTGSCLDCRSKAYCLSRHVIPKVRRVLGLSGKDVTGADLLDRALSVSSSKRLADDSVGVSVNTADSVDSDNSVKSDSDNSVKSSSVDSVKSGSVDSVASGSSVDGIASAVLVDGGAIKKRRGRPKKSDIAVSAVSATDDVSAVSSAGSDDGSAVVNQSKDNVVESVSDYDKEKVLERIRRKQRKSFDSLELF